MSGTGAAPMGRNEEDFERRSSNFNRDVSTQPATNEAEGNTNASATDSPNEEGPIMWANGAV